MQNRNGDLFDVSTLDALADLALTPEESETLSNLEPGIATGLAKWQCKIKMRSGNTK